MQLLKRIVCIVLVFITLMTCMIACGNKPQEAALPQLIPEQQLMADKYDRNEDLNQFMTFTTDYISVRNKLEVAALFNYPKIQIDDWETITIGVDKMQDVMAIIDAANTKYVKEQTDAIIAERQAAIDKEYAAAKASAEKKGKTYDQPKKQVRTDDIHFDNPYTLELYMDNKFKTPYEYQPTLLVDSAKNKGLYLIVKKYGIPYVRLDFVSMRDVFEYNILQEADWRINGVTAADVSSYIIQNEDGTVTTPEFVDVDNKNKAAKRNICMSGNIVFSGEGFTWDSLMMLCDAIDLEEKKNATHSFTQSSDKQFTYYTILITLNPFEYPDLYDLGYSDPQSKFIAPVAQLVATFDPLTQVCLNWDINLYAKAASYPNVLAHDLVDTLSVNVHEYQVDTNNYKAMREKQVEWIMQNAEPMHTAYVAIDDKDRMYGVVSTGAINLDREIEINGEMYFCREYTKTSATSGYGLYIKNSILDQMDDAEDPNKFVEENTLKLTIKFCVTDGNSVLGYINLDKQNSFISTNDQTYYVAHVETNELLQKAYFLTEDGAIDFITFLCKTYQLIESDYLTMCEMLPESGIIGVREHINTLFKQAEQDQANNTSIKGNIKNLLSGLAKKNSTENISRISLGEQTFDMTKLTISDLRDLGYAAGSEYVDKNAAMMLNGKFYTSSKDGGAIGVESRGEKITVITTADSRVQTIKGIHVGMSVKEALNLCDKTQNDIINNNFLILKTDTSTLVLEVNVWDDEIKEITWINNIVFSDEINEDSVTPEQQGPETQVDDSLSAMKTNTSVYLGSLHFDERSVNIFTLTENELFNNEITISNQIKVVSNALYEFKGVALTTSEIQDGLYAELVGKKGASAIYITDLQCFVSDAKIGVGTSRNRLQEVFKSDSQVDTSGDTIILKNGYNILLLDMKNDVVCSMCLINGEKFFTN